MMELVILGLIVWYLIGIMGSTIAYVGIEWSLDKEIGPSEWPSPITQPPYFFLALSGPVILGVACGMGIYWYLKWK